MKYLILSDIHANLQALDAVLATASAASWDRAIVLGDLVGYGADPNAVIERVLALQPLAVIRGNHDKVACGLDDGSSFNQVARFAAAWTSEQLTAAYRDYLRNLPPGPQIIDDGLEICHGSPFDEDHYIFDADDAIRAADAARRQLCLFGHTHLPVVFLRSGSELDGFVPPETPTPLKLELAPNVRYLVNVGSVGQPRDGDPRAAFAIYDSDGALFMYRMPYDVEGAQRRILAAGLPPSLANRLAIGR